MDLSVVVPIHNEVENIDTLHRELDAVLRALPIAYEVVYVDDGSADGSFELLQQLAERSPEIVVIRLSRNYGQTAAMAAGLAHARGTNIATMDGDRQNDPGDIPAMLAKQSEGYDLVCGWRKDRKDKWLTRRVPSQMANWLIGFITGVRLHDYGCTLKLVRGDLARSLRLYGEMHRFIPALIDDLGGRVVEMPVNHRPRVAGKSKYGITRTIRVILDLVTVKFMSSYFTRPIHIFGVFGLLSTFVGLVIVGVLGFERIVWGVRLSDRPLVLLGILLTIMGIQFITMGLLGELLIRTYHESQDKPVYRIAEVVKHEALGSAPRATRQVAGGAVGVG